MRKRSVRKVISKMLIVIIGSSMIGGLLANGITTNAKTNDTSINNPRISEDGTVTWDKITFGSYPQNASFIDEPIKWRILDIDSSGNAFLLADKPIDCKPYNDKGVEKKDSNGDTYIDYSCTWETCTLRDWLNGTDEYAGNTDAFINVAFTEEEKNAIISTSVENSENPSYNTTGGNNTNDKIYLLSISEASNAV